MKSPLLKSPLRFGLSFTLLVLPLAGAQTADEFFHRGAKHYLDGTNDLARAAVTNGLQLYPNDPKLTNLWELLNRSQQQQQQDKDQDKQDQQKQDQQKQDQQKQDKQKQDQQKQDQEKKDQQQKQDQQKPEDKQEQNSSKQDKDKKDGEKKEGQQASESKDKPEDPNDPDASPQGMASIRMTPQQAMQLLDMLKAEEKTMPFRPIFKTNRHERVFKDW